MSSACRAWAMVASIAAVETLKDQGVCRWNFVIRSMQQHAKNNIRSYYQAKKLSAQTSSAISNQMKRSKEESLRKVMDLSCWGPSTTSFIKRKQTAPFHLPRWMGAQTAYADRLHSAFSYFKTPWKGTTSIGAIILLLLTLVQSVCSVL